MNQMLDAIFQRRAIKVFDPVAIPLAVRTQVLDAASLGSVSVHATYSPAPSIRR